MKRIAIIGAGGHGREVAEILAQQAAQMGAFTVQGFIDENKERHGQWIDGLPVLGDWDWVAANKDGLAVICAVGTPAVMRLLVARAQALGIPFANAISPLAHVSPRATLGEGVSARACSGSAPRLSCTACNIVGSSPASLALLVSSAATMMCAASSTAVCAL